MNRNAFASNTCPSIAYNPNKKLKMSHYLFNVKTFRPPILQENCLPQILCELIEIHMDVARGLTFLCDAEVGLIIFSSTDKLYDYASTRSASLFIPSFWCD
ncbi:hypothetical protein GQ457_12G029300 [Hibiscus cannabinus]